MLWFPALKGGWLAGSAVDPMGGSLGDGRWGSAHPKAGGGVIGRLGLARTGRRVMECTLIVSGDPDGAAHTQS